MFLIQNSSVPNLLRRRYWLVASFLTLLIWLVISLAMLPLKEADGSYSSYPYGLVTSLENKSLDLLFQLRDARRPNLRSRGLSERITIVEINEDAIKASKVRLQKWPRDWYARLIDLASEGGASVIGLDTFLSEEGGVTTEDKASDQKLVESITNAGNVVLAMKTASGGFPEIRPLPMFVEGAYATGFVDIPLDKDGFVRNSQLFLARPGEDTQLSFATRLAEGYLSSTATEGITPPSLQFSSDRLARLGDRVVPLRNDLNLQLDFRGRSPAFRRISAAELLFKEQPQIPSDFFRDQIVLIGASNIDAPDLFPTPFYEAHALARLLDRNVDTAPKRTPGVEVHATAVATLLFGNALTRPRYLWLIRQGRAAEALQYLERAKSKSLVDALAGSNVNTRDPALQALLDRVRASADSVREAETSLALEMQKPAERRDATIVAQARARLEASQKQYLDAVAQIQRSNPSYASLVSVNPIDLVEARKRLDEKTLLLEYFPSDDELHIFVVTRNEGPVIRTVPIKRNELAKLVMQYREALSFATEQSVLDRSSRGVLWKDDGKGDYKTEIAPLKDATVKLYDALIAPVQPEVDSADKILIVPAGELYYLPFNGLGRVTPDGTFRFLIETKSFAYFASADLLNAIAAQSKSAKPRNSESTLLALGNPDGSLPAATTEVAALGRLFNGSNVYTGKDATVARVTATGANASYLHFATHGFINSLEPKESYLLLAGQPDRLSVKDLVEDNYKLSFAGTRLVTLSACETNIGGYDPSAVYSSLSRAFAKAGAPTVVASLWSVNDVSTRETMTTFYKQLAAGQPRGEAMRRAQLETMRDPRFAHPYYWAPFIVLGDWR